MISGGVPSRDWGWCRRGRRRRVVPGSASARDGCGGRVIPGGVPSRDGCGCGSVSGGR